MVVGHGQEIEYEATVCRSLAIVHRVHMEIKKVTDRGTKRISGDDYTIIFDVVTGDDKNNGILFDSKKTKEIRKALMEFRDNEGGQSDEQQAGAIDIKLMSLGGGSGGTKSLKVVSYRVRAMKTPPNHHHRRHRRFDGDEESSDETTTKQTVDVHIQFTQPCDDATALEECIFGGFIGGESKKSRRLFRRALLRHQINSLRKKIQSAGGNTEQLYFHKTMAVSRFRKSLLKHKEKHQMKKTQSFPRIINRSLLDNLIKGFKALENSFPLEGTT